MSLLRRTGRHEPMPDRFNELAEYNSRKGQGIAHDPEYDARMEALQLDFDIWQAESLRRRSDAGLLVTPCRRCGRVWRMNDPWLVLARERPVLRCADEKACTERMRERRQ